MAEVSVTKLIIRHGERVTEHPIADHALVVGRDPQCDLFFADKKLSRRHARFEKGNGGVRLIDLGSRNGCWVNEERVEDRLLSSDDSVRLGALAISLELDAEQRLEDEPRAETESQDDQESTLFLSNDEPSSDDSRTVVLASGALPDAPSPEDVGTVMLSAADAAPPEPVSPESDPAAGDQATAEVSDDDTTYLRAPASEAEAAPETTVVLGGGAPPAAADTGTLIFRGQSAPALDDATQLAPSASEPPVASVAPFDDDGESDWDTAPAADVVLVRSSGSFRFVALVLAVAALAVSVLALPLMRTLGSALNAESALRGRALVELLAVTNETALRDNRSNALSTARIASEPGVLAAYVLDPMGRVLAPKGPGAPEDGVFASLGSDIDAQGIRAFRESSGANGTVVYALPVLAEGRRLGIAVLHYRVGAAISTWTTVMLLLGSLLLLMGVGAAVVIARRWTLAPVQELRDDVEALRRGIVESVTEDRPYSDLATIARSFNEMAGRGESQPVGDASTTYKPRVDPTLVPDKLE